MKQGTKYRVANTEVVGRFQKMKRCYGCNSMIKLLKTNGKWLPHNQDNTIHNCKNKKG